MKLKNLFSVLLTVLLFCFAGLAFAQAVDPAVSYDEFFAFLMKSLGGFKGAGALGTVALVVQLLMKLFQTQAGELLGKYKLLAVLGLTLVGGVITLKLTGVSWGASLLHSATLAAAQVLIHQLYKQFLDKKKA